MLNSHLLFILKRDFPCVKGQETAIKNNVIIFMYLNFTYEILLFALQICTQSYTRCSHHIAEEQELTKKERKELWKRMERIRREKKRERNKKGKLKMFMEWRNEAMKKVNNGGLTKSRKKEGFGINSFQRRNADCFI
jgi:hypothetical protein